MQHIHGTDNTENAERPSSIDEMSQEQQPTQVVEHIDKQRSTRWDIIWLFLLTRGMLVLVTYFGYILLTQLKYSSAPVDIWTLISHWNRWDATRYLNIAIRGYQQFTSYHKPTGDFAFFPLFPVLVSILSRPFGNNNYLLLGMLISNLALLGTLFFLYALAKDLGGEQVGRHTILYLCIFPTAFFFFTAYNESLFLFFTTGGFLALRRQHWWLAGLAGGLSALTRSTGIFFVIPFLYELWVQREQIKGRWTTLTGAITPIILIPFGTALYCLYNWQATGNPIAFASVQYLWSRYLSLPWVGIWQNIGQVFWNQPFGSFDQVHALIDLVITLSFITLAIIGWRTSRMSYNIWLAFVFLYILITPSTAQADGLISNQRFVLEMFPAFITLAFLGQRYPRLHETLIWIFPTLLGIFSLLFVLGKWMV